MMTAPRMNTAWSGTIFGLALVITGILYLLADFAFVSISRQVLTGRVFMLFAGALVVRFLRRPAFSNLIAAAGLSFVGCAIILDETRFVDEQFLGVLLFGLMGAAFILAYFRNSKRWALIVPAGLFFSLSLVVLLDIFDLPEGVVASSLFFGFGVTFYILYLMRGRFESLDWAKFPALGLFGFSIFLFLIVSDARISQMVLPLLLILAGVLLVFSAPGNKLTEKHASVS